MNAWVCDGCGATRRDHPVGWLNVRPVIEREERERSLFDAFPRLYGTEQMFCSTDCIAAMFVLRGIEESA